MEYVCGTLTANPPMLGNANILFQLPPGHTKDCLEVNQGPQSVCVVWCDVMWCGKEGEGKWETWFVHQSTEAGLKLTRGMAPVGSYPYHKLETSLGRKPIYHLHESLLCV